MEFEGSAAVWEATGPGERGRELSKQFWWRRSGSKQAPVEVKGRWVDEIIWQEYRRRQRVSPGIGWEEEKPRGARTWGSVSMCGPLFSNSIEQFDSKYGKGRQKVALIQTSRFFWAKAADSRQGSWRYWHESLNDWLRALLGQEVKIDLTRRLGSKRRQISESSRGCGGWKRLKAWRGRKLWLEWGAGFHN